MADLLFEIGTEEIPASYIYPALVQMKEKFTRKAAELKINHGAVEIMGTPRRFVLLVLDVAEKQLDIKEELLGPSKKAAFDSGGKLTKAGEGFARSKGADIADLQVVDTAKGEYLMLVREVKGQHTLQLLPTVLQEILLELSFPKSMKWGNNIHSFARPIQWLTALLGKDIVEFTHEGITASNWSMGHRFLSNESFTVESPVAFEKQLADRYVIVDQKKRREHVLAEIRKAVAESKHLIAAQVAIDEGLVDTVTNLVEYPFGVCGLFDEKFLQLPPDVLITSMREHQKYFPVVAEGGELLPGFVAVNNTRVNEFDITRKGHQRVLRARLEDALFFFNTDRETRLEDRIPHLTGIIFQNKLGSMLEKNGRLVKLVRIIAEKVAPEIVEDGCRAARLCKADLLSDMVGEFPSLQGVMGAAYARHDGEKPEVALAIQEHYMPKRAGAPVPTTDIGAVLGLADRFDTLVGCFGIGQIPTGTADPFGLRRIALAIIHTLEEKGYVISLREIIHKALALYGDKVVGSKDTVDAVLAFIKGRFVNDCISRGQNGGVVEAAASVEFDDMNDCIKRIAAIAALEKEPAFAVLAASYKRIRNIVKDNIQTKVDPELFVSPAETNLYGILGVVQEEMQGLVADKEYIKALEALLKMKEPVDNFFNEVMVMAEDPAVRQNRLNLLTSFGALLLNIGDISKLQQ